MTTALIHGDPGSYKTCTLISNYLVPGLKAGRFVVTNIRGVKSIPEIEEIYKCKFPESAHLELVPFDKHGFRRMASFFHWVPANALIIMDEGQRVYPTRLRDFSYYDLKDHDDPQRPTNVEDSFDSHRHMGWDIYISTPNINKIHKEIRAIAEFGFRHKNLATVFSFMKGFYKRVTHIADNSGTSSSHVISSAIKRVDKRAFNVYQSTSSGQLKDSVTGFSFFKQPKVLLLLCILAYSCWNLVHTLSSKGLPAMFGGHPGQQTVSVANEPGQISASSAGGLSADSVPVRVDLQEPFRGLSIYSVGSINGVGLFQFKIDEDQYLSLDENDLVSLGFKVAKLSSSFYQVSWGPSVRIAAPKPSAKPVIPAQINVTPLANL